MNIKLKPGIRRGIVTAPISKSYAHRVLIAKALSNRELPKFSGEDCIDIEATRDALIKMKGAIIDFCENQAVSRNKITINCKESASTLRFLLPIIGAAGINCEAVMADSLWNRPIDELLKECNIHGMNIIKKKNNRLLISGKLMPGEYTVSGDITSQYTTGLLFALPLLNADSTLRITGNIVSKSYIDITEDILNKSGIAFKYRDGEYFIPGNQSYNLKENTDIEGDWSLGGVFLCMGAFSPGIDVLGLDINSKQGDRVILDILRGFHGNIDISGSVVVSKGGKLEGQDIEAGDIPDMVPVISVLAAAAKGTTRIKNVSRLHYKESDRIKAIIDMIHSLGGYIEYRDNQLIITGKGKLQGGVINSCKDHRIAMAGAVSSCICTGKIEILEYKCTDKSYPKFWEDFNKLEIINN